MGGTDARQAHSKAARAPDQKHHARANPRFSGEHCTGDSEKPKDSTGRLEISSNCAKQWAEGELAGLALCNTAYNSHTDAMTLQGFVTEHVAPNAKVYTDDAAAYKDIPFDHESVRHSVGEYVRDMAHTNGVESFWSMLKRAHKGTFHKISPKHLDRYVQEFAGKHNIRESGTLAQMRDTVARLVGRNLLYRDLVSDNGLSSGARS